MVQTKRIKAQDLRAGDHFWYRGRRYLAREDAAVLPAGGTIMVRTTSATIFTWGGTEVDWFA